MIENARTVLLVEDEPLVLRSTADLLAEDGYRVLEASSFDEALEQLGTCPDVAALVTDIGIAGDRDGIALTSAVRERCPGVRIVLVSGRTRPRADQYPSDAIFFTKPYPPEALLTVVRQSISGELAPRESMLEMDGARAF